MVQLISKLREKLRAVLMYSYLFVIPRQVGGIFFEGSSRLAPVWLW